MRSFSFKDNFFTKLADRITFFLWEVFPYNHILYLSFTYVCIFANSGTNDVFCEGDGEESSYFPEWLFDMAGWLQSIEQWLSEEDYSGGVSGPVEDYLSEIIEWILSFFYSEEEDSSQGDLLPPGDISAQPGYFSGYFLRLIKWLLSLFFNLPGTPPTPEPTPESTPQPENTKGVLLRLVDWILSFFHSEEGEEEKSHDSSSHEEEQKTSHDSGSDEEVNISAPGGAMVHYNKYKDLMLVQTTRVNAVRTSVEFVSEAVPSNLWSLPDETDNDDKRLIDYVDSFTTQIKPNNDIDVHLLISYKAGASTYNMMIVYNLTYENDSDQIYIIYNNIFEDLCTNAGIDNPYTN